MEKDVARSLQNLYLKGIGMYKHKATNLSNETRERLLTEAIAGWNKCQKVLDGQHTS